MSDNTDDVLLRPQRLALLRDVASFANLAAWKASLGGAASLAWANITGKPAFGTLALRNTVNGNDWSGLDLSVSDGGTGASTPSAARDALGLTIGANVQAWDADLDALAAITATGVVLARTPNGMKPATLSGITLGGTADAPVLTAAGGSSLPGPQQWAATQNVMNGGGNVFGYYYNNTGATRTCSIRVNSRVGNSTAIEKSSAASPYNFATVVASAQARGTTITGVTIEADASFRFTASGGDESWGSITFTA